MRLMKFTPTVLDNMRENGRKSFYYFSKGILLNDILDANIHLDMCQTLQGTNFEWSRLLLCGWRGCLKSTLMRYWALWMGLYNVNWSCLWIEQKADNAVEHHLMMQNLFRYGPQAGLLSELFSNRIPHGYEGWNSERTILNRTQPNAEPFCSIGAIEGRLEGKHRDALIIDDPEGADADKVQSVNADARRFIFERAEPLLISPTVGKILVGATPHGEDPTVWAIRDSEPDSTLDNSRRKVWKIWWKPVVDENGNTHWKERFPQNWVEDRIQLASMNENYRRLWDMQYLLRRRSDATDGFDLDRIESWQWEWMNRRLIRYPVIEYGPIPTNDVMPQGKVKFKTCDLNYVKFFLHGDPGHKEPGQMLGRERSSWAWVVVGVTPDFHAFAIEEWIEKDCSIDQYVDEFFRLYRKYAPMKVSFDPVGAQMWFVNIIRIMETTRYQHIQSMNTPWRRSPKRVVRPSSTLVEAHKQGREKMRNIMANLEAPHNMGWLHLNREATPKLFKEHEDFSSGSGSFDGLDALAQGPAVWTPGATPEAIRAMKMRVHIQGLIGAVSEPVSTDQLASRFQPGA